MPKKKRAGSRKSTSMSVGNISNVSREVNIAGRDVIKHEAQTELRNAFLDIHRDIDGLDTSLASKEDMKAEVKEIQTAVTAAARKNEKVDEGFIARRFRNLARMAPDMLDVGAAMLASPLAGLGVAAKKIAEKAKEDAK